MFLIGKGWGDRGGDGEDGDWGGEADAREMSDSISRMPARAVKKGQRDSQIPIPIYPIIYQTSVLLLNPILLFPASSILNSPFPVTIQ